MKTIKLFLLLTLTSVFAQAQTIWNVDNVHSTVRFTIAHMVISEIDGNFTDFSGSINYTKPDLSDAAIDFSINTNSVNTRNAKRDGHLKSPDFFDVSKYPTINFKSTSVTHKEGKNYLLKGHLTMHGVTKPIELNLFYAGSIKDNRGNFKAGYKVKGSLKRSDYGLKYNSVMDNGGVVIGNKVSFDIKLENKQAKK